LRPHSRQQRPRIALDLAQVLPNLFHGTHTCVELYQHLGNTWRGWNFRPLERGRRGSP